MRLQHLPTTVMVAEVLVESPYGKLRESRGGGGWGVNKVSKKLTPLKNLQNNNKFAQGLWTSINKIGSQLQDKNIKQDIMSKIWERYRDTKIYSGNSQAYV